jgi:hypothetical protein
MSHTRLVEKVCVLLICFMVFPPGRAPYSRKREKTFDGLPLFDDKFTRVQRVAWVAIRLFAAKPCTD